jgi:hypothetical protein
MLIEKYKIEEFNNEGLKKHQREFEFVASSVKKHR